MQAIKCLNMKELLKKIIFEQQEYCKNIAQDTVPRTIEEEWLTTTEILIITGIRRCGKSVLLQQMRNKLPEQDFFFNFDDERLVNFTVSDFQTLQECFFELFGEQHTYYFDEIQNVKGWETFVRRLYNEGNKTCAEPKPSFSPKPGAGNLPRRRKAEHFIADRKSVV